MWFTKENQRCFTWVRNLIRARLLSNGKGGDYKHSCHFLGILISSVHLFEFWSLFWFPWSHYCCLFSVRHVCSCCPCVLSCLQCFSARRCQVTCYHFSFCLYGKAKVILGSHCVRALASTRCVLHIKLNQRHSTDVFLGSMFTERIADPVHSSSSNIVFMLHCSFLRLVAWTAFWHCVWFSCNIHDMSGFSSKCMLHIEVVTKLGYKHGHLQVREVWSCVLSSIFPILDLGRFIPLVWHE